MKQKQKILLSIGLGIVILLNVLLLGWLLTEFFSGLNGPEETVATTDSGEETIGEETTVGEEITSQEVTTEEPTTEETTPEETIGEWIEAEIPFADIEKEVIRTFRWGDRNNQLGYSESDIGSFYPVEFMVGESLVCVLDNENSRILIQYKGQHHEIPLNKLYTSGYLLEMWQLDGWITLWNYMEDKLMLYRPESGAEIHLDLSTVLKDHQKISAFLEIGSSHVVWTEPSGDKEAVYRYDWTENKVSIVTLQEKNTPTVSMEGVLPFIIGTHEDNVYYCQYGENLDSYILNRETSNYHLYTEIEFAPYRTAPRMYLSPDGHLYIMEMFEDRVEISEINLTPEMVKE